METRVRKVSVASESYLTGKSVAIMFENADHTSGVLVVRDFEKIHFVTEGRSKIIWKKDNGIFGLGSGWVYEKVILNVNENW